jgi:uncharacterized membrane protein YhaH (DUF805 family)
MQQVCEVQEVNDFIRQDTEQKHYGGIRRIGYFFGMLGAGVLSTACNVATEGEPSVALLGLAVVNVLAFILVVNRLHNIGMSGWWSLLILVPIANIYIGIKCLVCPEGYEDTKTLDTAGKIIAGIFIGFVVFVIVSLVVALSGS